MMECFSYSSTSSLGLGCAKPISFLRKPHSSSSFPCYSTTTTTTTNHMPHLPPLNAANLNTHLLKEDMKKNQHFRSFTDPEEVPVSPDNLHDWVHNSVTEIVRNIEEAPFLMHIYSKKSKSSSSTSVLELEREKAVADSWAYITRRWDQGSPIPDGIILVEQLPSDHDDDGHVLQPEIQSSSHNNSSTTKAWGLLIQGRGVDTAPACYILKTSRVLSSCGFCTHFCLVRAKCFGDAPQLQLSNSWLIPN